MSLRTTFQNIALGSVIGFGAIGTSSNASAQEQVSKPSIKDIEDTLNNMPIPPGLVRRLPNSPPTFYERVRDTFGTSERKSISRFDHFKAMIEKMKSDGATKEDIEKKILEIIDQLSIEHQERTQEINSQIEDRNQTGILLGLGTLSFIALLLLADKALDMRDLNNSKKQLPNSIPTINK